MEWVRERQEQFFYLAYSITLLAVGSFLSGLGIYLAHTQKDHSSLWVFNCVLPGLFQLFLGAAMVFFGCSAGLHSCLSDYLAYASSASAASPKLEEAARPLLAGFSSLSTTQSMWGSKLGAAPKSYSSPSSC
ncbi:hypothetical protein QOT17_023467 [Balamuthia mandrillaris]